LRCFKTVKNKTVNYANSGDLALNRMNRAVVKRNLAKLFRANPLFHFFVENHFPESATKDAILFSAPISQRKRSLLHSKWFAQTANQATLNFMAARLFENF